MLDNRKSKCPRACPIPPQGMSPVVARGGLPSAGCHGGPNVALKSVEYLNEKRSTKTRTTTEIS